MPNVLPSPIRFLHRRVCSSAPTFSPSLVRCRIIASLTDASRSASGVPVKWLVAQFCCVLTPPNSRRGLFHRGVPRADKIDAIPLRRYGSALLTFPPLTTRFTECIGCDHAAHLQQ